MEVKITGTTFICHTAGSHGTVLQFSEMLHHVDWPIVTKVSEEHSVSIYTLHPKIGGVTLLWHICIYRSARCNILYQPRYKNLKSPAVLITLHFYVFRGSLLWGQMAISWINVLRLSNWNEIQIYH